MIKFSKLLSLAGVLSVLSVASAVMAQDSATLVTSSGQALDAFTVKTMLTRSGVANTYDPVATVEQLDGIKTLIIAFGASIKGFGAAGITAETEMERTRTLLAEAETRGIKVVGVHIGGTERREGLSEQFVQLVANEADALVVWKAGDEDGFFTKAAADRGIPLTLIDMPMKVGEAVSAQLAE
jgi:hypothetical protein